jgi:hypothetical protein
MRLWTSLLVTADIIFQYPVSRHLIFGSGDVSCSEGPGFKSVSGIRLSALTV